ncbi:unnamed protein product [Owenia fusiformis]|uniref:Schlafen AlbA-2 domain-containing protein n=1 Tax=Owenia fusiformis TaxID=6347 RepID=A0A8S4N325_OWEFU|nr:unnamed protein product [Owenia fusiformis]CAH1774690.1 unnamed protein product [Owenia fusiformis]
MFVNSFPNSTSEYGPPPLVMQVDKTELPYSSARGWQDTRVKTEDFTMTLNNIRNDDNYLTPMQHKLCSLVMTLGYNSCTVNDVWINGSNNDTNTASIKCRSQEMYDFLYNQFQDEDRVRQNPEVKNILKDNSYFVDIEEYIIPSPSDMSEQDVGDIMSSESYTYRSYLGAETRNVEFKKGGGGYIQRYLRDDIEKYTVAFLNSHSTGSFLLIGVTDDGYIEGVHVNHANEDHIRKSIIDPAMKAITGTPSILYVSPDMYRVDFVPVMDDRKRVIRDQKVIRIKVCSSSSRDLEDLYATSRMEVYERLDGSVTLLDPLKIQTRLKEMLQKSFKEQKEIMNESHKRDLELKQKDFELETLKIQNDLHKELETLEIEKDLHKRDLESKQRDLELERLKIQNDYQSKLQDQALEYQMKLKNKKSAICAIM